MHRKLFNYRLLRVNLKVKLITTKGKHKVKVHRMKSNKYLLVVLEVLKEVQKIVVCRQVLPPVVSFLLKV